ncbi:hypothetical protein BDN70DRAFT_896488 [Pholiota conissans]|uniref:Uncharacterized protein n=1 Tax=Pholiota conissans TaxID=109636 RepID=A0A9P6CSN1_9AGAR|nr:hypothetical protein BDN70DRAFT_896488 [Pholiota conissans]
MTDPIRGRCTGGCGSTTLAPEPRGVEKLIERNERTTEGGDIEEERGKEGDLSVMMSESKDEGGGAADRRMRGRKYARRRGRTNGAGTVDVDEGIDILIVNTYGHPIVHGPYVEGPVMLHLHPTSTSTSTSTAHNHASNSIGSAPLCRSGVELGKATHRLARTSASRGVGTLKGDRGADSKTRWDEYVERQCAGPQVVMQTIE